MPDGSCSRAPDCGIVPCSMGVGSCVIGQGISPEPNSDNARLTSCFLYGSHNLKLKKLCYICIGNNLIKVKTNLFIPTINSRLLQRCNRFFKWCKICLKPVFCPCISVQAACTGVRAVTGEGSQGQPHGTVPAFRAFLCPDRNAEPDIGRIGCGSLNSSCLQVKRVTYIF